MPPETSESATAVETLVQQLQLRPHPEGGWFRECHRSSASVTRVDGEQRSACTQILYLLAEGGISRWHRVRQADEIWQFLAGEPLELWLLPPEGGTARCHDLRPITLGAGPAADTGPVAVVPADWWQAARTTGTWSLVSCVVSPGFVFDDFDLLHQRPQDHRPHGALPGFL